MALWDFEDYQPTWMHLGVLSFTLEADEEEDDDETTTTTTTEGGDGGRRGGASFSWHRPEQDRARCFPKPERDAFFVATLHFFDWIE